MKPIFLLSYSKELSKWWRMAFIYCDSTPGGRVIQDFDLYKLDDLWRHNVDTKWCIIKIEYLSRLFLYRTETYSTVVTLITKFHDMSTVTFPCQHNGLHALSIQRGKISFFPSRSVICSCCSFTGYERIWTLHSTSIRKSFNLWSNK